MSDKLDWIECGKSAPEYYTIYRGFRIRAVHDDSPENPFEAWDGHWPMIAYCERTEANYDTKLPGKHITREVLDRLNDAQLVHDQKAIAKLLCAEAYDVRYHLNASLPYEEEIDEVPRWITDHHALRDWLAEAYDGLSRSEQWEACEGLYQILGIPYLRSTSTGYSQGDWADLLIVATPEAQAQLRSKPAGMSDEDWAKVLADDMEGQAKLYKAWAFGDVYGYVVEKPVPAENDEDLHCQHCGRDNTGHDGEPCLVDDCPLYEITEGWVDACDDNSCWGFYGSDFDKSGLEEQARAVIDHLLDNPTIKQEAPVNAEA